MLTSIPITQVKSWRHCYETQVTGRVKSCADFLKNAAWKKIIWSWNWYCNSWCTFNEYLFWHHTVECPFFQMSVKVFLKLAQWVEAVLFFFCFFFSISLVWLPERKLGLARLSSSEVFYFLITYWAVFNNSIILICSTRSNLNRTGFWYWIVFASGRFYGTGLVFLNMSVPV